MVSASRVSTPVPDVLGLVETPATGLPRPSVWTPFAAAWTGTTHFEAPQAGVTLMLVGHIELRDAWNVNVHDEARERMFTVPGLIALDGPRRLRVAFLTWTFEYRLPAGQAADWETVLFLSEL